MTPRNVQDAIALHDGRCYEFVAHSLSEPMFGSYDEQAVEIQTKLLLAAGFAVRQMRESGWDLMFDANGKFLAVVT